MLLCAEVVGEMSELAKSASDSAPPSEPGTFPQRTLSKCDIVPDVKELTLKNLDTGEEYIIGENDPDFEFNTFALTGDGEGLLLLLLMLFNSINCF